MGSERRDSGRPAAGASGYTHTPSSSSNRIREQRQKEKKGKRGHPYIITGLSGLDNHTACNPLNRNPLGAFLYYMNYTPPVAYFGSIQQQKPSLHKFLLGGRNIIIISFQSSLNICHSGVIRFLATSPRGLLLLSGSTTYNTSLSLL